MSGASLTLLLSKIGRGAGTIVLPARCVACDEVLPWIERRASCCETCWRRMDRIDDARCLRCALPVPAGTATRAPIVCLECRRVPPPLEWTDSWGHYQGSLEAVLLALKFRGHDFLADLLSDHLLERLIERSDVRFDALVPVPLHRSRLRRRGFNQAELLARGLEKRTAIPVRRMLRKVRDNEAQSTLPRRAREANVHRAFEASPRVHGLSLLVVDDVCTTGATLRSCARSLLDAGADRVCAVTVARA